MALFQGPWIRTTWNFVKAMASDYVVRITNFFCDHPNAHLISSKHGLDEFECPKCGKRWLEPDPSNRL